MKVVGYADIKKDAMTCSGAKNTSEFIGQTCLVMEFTPEGDVLVMNPAGTALAMFDACDVSRKFECKESGQYILPPNLNIMAEMAYMTKLMNRKGGWSQIVKQLVIAASLHKGEYSDGFLFQIQREEEQGISYKNEDQ